MDSKEYKIISTQNTLLSMLIIINLILVCVALYLFMRDADPALDSSSQPKSTLQTSQAPAKQRITKADLQDVTDKQGNGQQPDLKIRESLATITQSLNDLGTLSSKDEAYVKALDDLKREVDSRMNISKPTIADIKSHKATKQTTAKPLVDHFNKVDVSKLQSQEPTNNRSILSSQIAQIVAEPEMQQAEIKKTVSKPDDDNYLKKLKTESIERKNEMRTVTVVEGDRLWDIAKRAYGNGLEYPRIFKANPGLKNPDRIEIGMRLRVPL